jgi:hypothetical protein
MRTALLAAAIVGLVPGPGWAQFGDMPGLPGRNFNRPPHDLNLPPHCQQILTLRTDLQRHGDAINAARARRADAQTACRLFRTYLTAKVKLLEALDANGPKCGVPEGISAQIKANHAAALQTAQRLCAVVGRGRLHQPLGDFWTPDELQRLFQR